MAAPIPLLRLHPILAFLLLVGLGLSVLPLMRLGPVETTFPLAVAAVALVIFGYMVSVALGLAALLPERVRVKRLRLLGVFAFAVVFDFFGLRILQLLAEGDPLERGVLMILWLLGVAAPLYICGIASRSLVAAEQGREFSRGRCVGTFLLFYLLPIGIIFIQTRLRRLLAAVPPDEPSGQSLAA